MYTVTSDLAGSYRFVGNNERVVSKAFVDQAVEDAGAKVALRKEAERLRSANKALSEQLYNRTRDVDKLTAEVSDLKDLLKQTTEYAVRRGEKLRPGVDSARLAWALGGAQHLNIEIEEAFSGKKIVRVWAPAPPDPDADVKKAIATVYPVNGSMVLSLLRGAGLDITLKSQGKGKTVNAATPSLKSVS